MTKWTGRVLACGFIWMGLGCAEVHPNDSSEGLNGSESGKSDSAWVSLEDGTQVPAVQGTYHLLLDGVTQVRDIEDGDEKTLTTEAHVLVTVMQEGAQLGFYLDFCELILPEISGKKPYIETETIRLFSSLFSTGEIGLQGEQWVVRMDRVSMGVGVSLPDPEMTPMPTDDDDPMLVDTDGDGKPGVSLKVDGYPFSIYVALRTNFAFGAVVYSEGAVLQGDAEMGVESVIYGDNIPFVNAKKQLEKSLEKNQVLSAVETATLIRVASPEGVSCENMVTLSTLLTDGLDGQPPLGSAPGTGTIEEFVGDAWDSIELDEDASVGESSDALESSSDMQEEGVFKDTETGEPAEN